MISMWCRLALAGLLLLVQESHAQSRQVLAQEARFEVEIGSADDHQFLFSMEEEGLILIRDFRKYENGKKVWEITTLDTAMNVTWATRLETDPEHRLLGYEYKPGRFHLLFQRERFDDFQGMVAEIDLTRRESALDPVKIQLGIRLTHYTVAGRNTILGGYIGSQPAIAIIDGRDHRSKVLPGFFQSEADLLELKPNRNNTFTALQLVRRSGEDILIYGAYDEDGGLLVEDRFTVPQGITVMSATASSLKESEVLVSGIYTYGKSPQAAGFFHAMVKPFNENGLELTDFPLLRHFTDYMPDKKSAHVREKARQRKIYGRPSDFRISAAIRRIDERPDGFFIFGEGWSQSSANNPANQAFPPVYNRPFGNPYYPGWGYWGPGAMRYGFDPFQPNTMASTPEYSMETGFVVFCDAQGRLRWDRSAPLDETRVYAPEQFSDYAVTGERTGFIFPTEKGLSYSDQDSIRADAPADMKMQRVLTLPPSSGLSKEEDFSDVQVRRWFRNRFFAYGTQDILQGKERKRVFFIVSLKLAL